MATIDELEQLCGARHDSPRAEAAWIDAARSSAARVMPALLRFVRSVREEVVVDEVNERCTVDDVRDALRDALRTLDEALGGGGDE